MKYQFNWIGKHVKNWLQESFNCSLPQGAFIQILRTLWEYHSGQWNDEGAHLLSLFPQSFNKETAGLLAKYLLSTQGHEASYREWAARVLPIASRAHWETLAFGQRVDRNSYWGKISNKEANAMLAWVRSSGKIDFTAPGKASKWADKAVSSSEDGYKISLIFAYKRGTQRVPIEQNFESEQKPTRRGSNLQHNARRFGRWALQSTGPELERARGVWSRSRPYFREVVFELYGGEVDEWLNGGCGSQA
uniref:Uncharacterized protein n=1 Tax=Sichuan mosquito tombus-like virus TaxID=2864009 RepID=A0A8K1HJA0_9TOMB|nr:hypothetical protein 1 [Sichuan mosquito tombus-like virus]